MNMLKKLKVCGSYSGSFEILILYILFGLKLVSIYNTIERTVKLDTSKY